MVQGRFRVEFVTTISLAESTTLYFTHEPCCGTIITKKGHFQTIGFAGVFPEEMKEILSDIDGIVSEG
jgi:hypothetical protein